MGLVLVAIGSRGDVAPFVGLARRMSAAGVDIAVATHEPFRSMVEKSGLSFRAIPGDIASVVSVPSTDTPPSPMFMSRRVGELSAYLRGAALGSIEATRDASGIIVTGTAPFAYDIAEAMGVPSLGAYLQPYAASAAYPPILLNSSRSWGGPVNKALGALAPAMVFPYTRATAAVRRATGLPRRGALGTRRRQDKEQWPVLHGYSPAVLPRPRDWRPGLEVVGYWWPDEGSGWQPPPELTAFLDAGPAPVVITFGSMAAGAGAWLADAVGSAVRTSGVRAIVQAGWAQLAVDASDQVLPLGEAPHSWLFPRASAVVHHGGAGTSGAVFRAGIPAVVTPIYADQPLWASRAHVLGVGPSPIPFTKLTGDRLAAAIADAVGQSGFRQRATSLATSVNADNGARPVIEAVQSW